jgi:hypothetical protein
MKSRRFSLVQLGQDTYRVRVIKPGRSLSLWLLARLALACVLGFAYA